MLHLADFNQETLCCFRIEESDSSVSSRFRIPGKEFRPIPLKIGDAGLYVIYFKAEMIECPFLQPDDAVFSFLRIDEGDDLKSRFSDREKSDLYPELAKLLLFRAWKAEAFEPFNGGFEILNNDRDVKHLLKRHELFSLLPVLIGEVGAFHETPLRR
jgi:hypothetical protein